MMAQRFMATRLVNYFLRRRARLLREQRTVNADVAGKHFEALIERIVDDLSVLHVHFVRERDGVGHRPRVALTGDGAQLIGRSQALVVGGDDGGEGFPRELLPEMIEEVLQRAREAAVVIRRAEQDYVRSVHPGFQLREGHALVRDFRVEQRERFFGEVQQIHLHAGGGELVGNVLDHRACRGGTVRAAGDGENVKRCH
jgi:hypothetical protein